VLEVRWSALWVELCSGRGLVISIVSMAGRESSDKHEAPADLPSIFKDVHQQSHPYTHGEPQRCPGLKVLHVASASAAEDNDRRR
jgi:hypothetical protein